MTGARSSGKNWCVGEREWCAGDAANLISLWDTERRGRGGGVQRVMHCGSGMEGAWGRGC